MTRKQILKRKFESENGNGNGNGNENGNRNGYRNGNGNGNRVGPHQTVQNDRVGLGCTVSKRAGVADRAKNTYVNRSPCQTVQESTPDRV